MIQFIAGAVVASVASKKLKNKTKDDIKKDMEDTLSSIGKIACAGSELVWEKIEKKCGESNANINKDNNNRNMETIIDKVLNKD